ncbi:MAG: hypothetical protein AAF557_15490 [Pseudomonadota bacterium]
MGNTCGRARLGLASMLCIAMSVPIWATPSQAQANCGDFYRIQRGDTLRDITRRTLGHDRYRVVFGANRDILPSPERIETGQLIFLPCEDSGAKDRRSALVQAGLTPTQRDNLGDKAAADAPPENEVNVVTPYAPKFPGKSRVAPQVATQDPTTPQQQGDRPFNIITASGMSPLADFALPEGGLLSVLIKEALQAGGNSAAHEISFVDDRKAHLAVLMPTGAFDLTFPWPGVDCAGQNLGPAATALCRDFLISRPVYEAMIGTIVPSGSPLVSATSATALQNQRLCRPMGFPPVDLEAMGLDVRVILKRTAAECVAAIEASEADGMSVVIASSSSPTWSGLVAAPGLSWPIPVHALAWRGDPEAEQSIAILNQGLQRLQRSGRWFKIVSAYLRNVNAGEAVTGN